MLIVLRSSEMFLKQEEMDAVVEEIYSTIATEEHLKSTLFVLAGDHGMNEKGNHGGCTSGETAAALLFASPSFRNLELLPITPVGNGGVDFIYHKLVDQADLVPTLASLMGFPVPVRSAGVLISDFLGLWSAEEQLRIMEANEAQLSRLLALANRTAEATTPNSSSDTDVARLETVDPHSNTIHRVIEVRFPTIFSVLTGRYPVLSTRPNRVAENISRH